jgi:hypothetical protein
MELGVETSALVLPIAWTVAHGFRVNRECVIRWRALCAIRPVKLDTSAHDLRLNYVEGAFNGHEPDVDRIDDAIASEEKG